MNLSPDLVYMSFTFWFNCLLKKMCKGVGESFFLTPFLVNVTN